MGERFKAELLTAATARLNQRGIPSNFLIITVLREQIEIGVNNMKVDELDDPKKRKLAIDNLNLLIDAVYKRSLNEGLQTRTFSNVRASICPLWPFC